MSKKVFLTALVCCSSSLLCVTSSFAITYSTKYLAQGGRLVYGISNETPVGASLSGGFAGASEEHAVWWKSLNSNVIDLNPTGYRGSDATDISGTNIVGRGYTTFTNPFGSTQNTTHAMYWQGTAAGAVDLNPRGFDYSEALGVSEQTQVGFALGGDGWDRPMLWHGTAASANDLTPNGFYGGVATDAANGYQVGYLGSPNFTAGYHATLWSGSATSAVDLNPTGFDWSKATGVTDTYQVGYVVASRASGITHAALWHGSADSFVDLNPPGATSSMLLGAGGDYQVGSAYFASDPNHSHAMIWHGTADSAIDLFPAISTFLQNDNAEALAVDAAGDVVGRIGQTYFPVLWIPITDFNGNGTTDAADYVLWRNNPNADPGDYAYWRAHFGESSTGAGAGSNAAVPEPTAFAVLGLALVSIAFSREGLTLCRRIR